MTEETVPTITKDRINEVILGIDYHVFPQLTVCCLTLENGFTVTGESACVSPENFYTILSKEIALNKAKDKIRMLEGYLLKQQQYQKAMEDSDG